MCECVSYHVLFIPFFRANFPDIATLLMRCKCYVLIFFKGKRCFLNNFKGAGNACICRTFSNIRLVFFLVNNYSEWIYHFTHLKIWSFTENAIVGISRVTDHECSTVGICLKCVRASYSSTQFNGFSFRSRKQCWHILSTVNITIFGCSGENYLGNLYLRFLLKWKKSWFRPNLKKCWFWIHDSGLNWKKMFFFQWLGHVSAIQQFCKAGLR